MVEIFFEFQCMILSSIMLIGVRTEEFSSERAKKIINLLMASTLICSFCYLTRSCWEGHVTLMAWWMVRIGEFGVNFIQYGQMLLLSITIYLIHRQYDSETDGRWLAVPVAFMIILEGILILSQFSGMMYWFDERNVYHQGSWLIRTSMLAIVGLSAGALHMVRFRKIFMKEEKLAFCVIYGVMAFFVAMEAFFGYSMTVVGETVSMLLLYLINSFRNRRSWIQRERKLLQTRAYLQNSQVNPHFIYNSLSIIQGLIDEDPCQAEEAIGHLAKFFRKDLDLKMREDLISVKEEMQYVRDYLFIEGLRFEEKLRVVFDIDETLDFGIPFLSIQPLVENAIRHGIRMKDGAGTVKICIFRDKEMHVVEINDDGVGFDKERLKQSASEGIRDAGTGLRSVQERIVILCGGSMKVESEMNMGTTVRILIPADIREN